MRITDSSERDCVTLYEVSRVDSRSNLSLAEELAESRTQPTSPSGYMMRFDPLEYLHLSPFDVVEVEGDSYPVPETALDSLPVHIQAELEDARAVQLVANYDSDAGVFESAFLPDLDKPFAERAAELMELPDVSFKQAADYITVVEKENYSKEDWTEIREVSRGGINASIRTVEKALEKHAKSIASSTNEDVDGASRAAEEQPLPAETEK